MPGSRWIALLCVALMPVASAQETLQLSLQNNGCRLSILADGSARIGYGAVPHTAQVAAGRFDFEALVESFSARSLPWRPRADLGAPWASVVLPGSNVPRLLQDTNLVRRLLEQAWSLRLPAQSSWESEQHDWLERACAFE